MAKRKLARFAEMESFQNVLQPDFTEVFRKDHAIKGKWRELFFKNSNPLVIELGCGKGEYTVGLAKKYSEKNFIGIDIKGARIWRGAKTALDENIKNAGFLRTRIEFIDSFFQKNEVDEIWLTFPDPQPKKSKKRLSSGRFLNIYRNFIKHEGIVHLKTDNKELYQYTLSLARSNNLKIEAQTDDLYANTMCDEILGIRTFYEKQFLEKGLKIHYLKFRLPEKTTIIEPTDEK